MSDTMSVLSSRDSDAQQEHIADLTGRVDADNLGARLASCYGRHRRRVRRVGSWASILVLAWSFVAYGSFVSVVEEFGRVVMPKDLFWSSALPQLIMFSSWMLLFPFFSWLADVHLGRYKMLSIGLHLLWAGAVAFGTGLILNSLLDMDEDEEYYALIPSVILVTLGSGVYTVNSVLFGLDQTIGVSAEETSAYFIWYFFSWLSSRWVYSLLRIGISECTDSSYTNLFLALFSIGILSLALCSNYIFKERMKLVIDRPSENSWSLTWNVLKYTVTHSKPVVLHARALTKDQRIDYASTSYGGPFTTGQVNDVKALLRICTIILGFCGLGMFIGGFSQISEYFLVQHLGPSLHGCRSLLETTYSYTFLVTVGVPLYEFVVYPAIRPWIPTMLKRVGISVILALLLNIDMLSVSIAHVSIEHSEWCFLEPNNMTSHISSFTVELPFNILYAAMVVTAMTAALEFICAQTPYNMYGLAVGILFGLTGLSAVLGLVLIVIWRHYARKRKHCGVGFFGFTTALASIVLVAYGLLTYYYKRREREDRVPQVHPKRTTVHSRFYDSTM